MKPKLLNRLVMFSILMTTIMYFSPLWKERQIPFPGHLLVSFFSPWKDATWPGYPTGVPRKDLLGFDTVRMMGPWRRFITQEIERGRLPTWNPHQFAGAPLLANFQSAIFFPPNLLYLILPFHIAWTILVISQPLIATVGMYLFLKSQLIDKKQITNNQLLITIFLSLAYGFSAWMSVWIEWNIHGFIYALLPWVLLFIYRRKTILTILTISTIIFSGHPQMAFIGITALTVAALVWKKFRWFVKILAISMLVTSIQWLPSVTYYREASREQPSSEFVYEKTLLPWSQVSQLIAPNFLGNPATGNFRGTANFVETTAYSGIAILGFALIGVFYSLNKQKQSTINPAKRDLAPPDNQQLTINFSLLLLFLIFVMVLPNPLSLLIGKLNIPILSTSVASRWLILWPLATILLAAAALDAAAAGINDGSFGSLRNFQSTNRVSQTSIKFYFPAIFISILIGVLWITALLSPPEFRSVSLRNLIIPTGIATFWIITNVFPFIKFLPKKLYRPSAIASHLYSVVTDNVQLIAPLVVLLLSLYEFVSFGHKTMTYTEKEFIYPSTPVIRKLQELSADYSRFASTPGNAIETNFATEFGLYDLAGYDALYPRRIGELVWAAHHDGQPIKDFSRSTVVTPAAISLARDNLWNLAGVRWILNKDDMLPEHPGQRSNDVYPDFKLIWEEGKWQIYENTNAFPRAFFIENGDWIGDGDEIISRVLHPPISLIPLITPAEIIAYQPTKVEINVQARSGGYLVLTDTFYPGWKATVDGKSETIFPAFHAFRAVSMSPGNHKVVFLYNSL